MKLHNCITAFSLIERLIIGNRCIDSNSAGRAPAFTIEGLEHRLFLSAGAIDSSFGNGGLAMVGFNGPADAVGEQVLVQPDGKTVIAGTTGNSDTLRVIVARYNADGTLDHKFATGGMECIPELGSAYVAGLAIQPDHKIDLAMATEEAPCTVIRLIETDPIDSMFGQSGQVQLSELYSRCIAITPDDRIIIGGETIPTSSGVQHAILTELNLDGTINEDFGANGSVTDALLPEAFGYFSGVALDDSGRILAVGSTFWTSAGGGKDIGVARFNSNGTLDTTFATGGVNTQVAGGGSQVTVGPDGSIVIGGQLDVAGQPPTNVIARLTTSGIIDPTFANGLFEYPASTGYSPSTLVVTDTNGVLAGWGGVLLRLTNAGRLDATYNKTGIAETPPYQNQAYAIAADGSVSATGSTFDTSGLAVSHFTPNGVLDSSFGGVGYVFTPVSEPVESVVNAVALQSDGKTVTALSVFGQGPKIVRFNADGTIDDTFGIGGIVNLSTSIGAATSLVVQPSGDIVVAGSMFGVGVSLFRVLPNGQLDPDFGTDGQLVLFAAGGSNGSAGTPLIAQRPNGTIVIVDQPILFNLPFLPGPLVVAQITSSGLLDESFGGGGIENVAVPMATPVGLAIDSGGNIEVAGTSRQNQFLLARLTPQGALDPSFGGGAGYVTTAFPAVGLTAFDYGFALQPDGKAVLAGAAGSFTEPELAGAVPAISAPNEIVLARYNNDGSLDASFGDLGRVQLSLPFLTSNVTPVLSLADGSVLLSGTIAGNNEEEVAVAHLTAYGAVDPNFGQAGVVQSNISRPTFAECMVVRADGEIVVGGASYNPTLNVPNAAAVQFFGLSFNVITGTATVDHITLRQDQDHRDIDWSLNGGQPFLLPINDPSGLTINGNGGDDTITLEYSNGNPLPATLHLNGTFTVDGLQGSNPLAGTTLEIGKSTVYISYANPKSDPVTLIRSYLQNGFANGAWNGTPTASTGVITSAAATNDPTQMTAVGYADSADKIVRHQPPHTIEVTYALYGDTNLDGAVDLRDLATLMRHYDQTAGGTWDTGDFNYDGSVNFNDFTLLTRGFNRNMGGASLAGVAAVTAAPDLDPASANRSRKSR